MKLVSFEAPEGAWLFYTALATEDLDDPCCEVRAIVVQVFVSVFLELMRNRLLMADTFIHLGFVDPTASRVESREEGVLLFELFIVAHTCAKH